MHRTVTQLNSNVLLQNDITFEQLDRFVDDSFTICIFGEYFNLIERIKFEFMCEYKGNHDSNRSDGKSSIQNEF